MKTKTKEEIIDFIYWFINDQLTAGEDGEGYIDFECAKDLFDHLEEQGMVLRKTETNIQQKAEELTRLISDRMDAHLFESIVSLFNNGVLKYYVQTPRTNVDTKNFKLSVEAADAVRFEGREKIIELEKKLANIQGEK